MTTTDSRAALIALAREAIAFADYLHCGEAADELDGAAVLTSLRERFQALTGETVDEADAPQDGA